PEGDQALVLGANGLALALAGALRWNGVGAQRAVAVVVGEAPVHVQGGAAAELQAAGVVRVNVAHRGWLGTEGLTELGQLRVERGFLIEPFAHQGDPSRGVGLVVEVSHGSPPASRCCSWG